MGDNPDLEARVRYSTLSGYIELQYTWPWDALCATVSSVDSTHSVIFTFGLNPPADSHAASHSGQSPSPAAQTAGAQILEGAWWKEEADVTGFITLSNTTEQPLPATVQVSDANANPLGTYAVTVSPHGTKRVDLQELAPVTHSLGGLRVTFNGTPDALVVNGALEDLSKGYSAGVPFGSAPAASATASTVSYAELGLMAGAADPMMHFPGGTVFKPYSVVRNLGTQPISVTPVLYWMQGGGALASRLASFTLSPLQTESLDVLSLLSLSGLKDFNGAVNLVLEVQGPTGSALLASGSVDQSNTYVFEVVPRSVKESASKNLSYWSTANGEDTMVTLWNPADEAQDFVFTIFFSGGRYLLPVHLDPRAAHTFNVSEVIENQIPDSDGNVIPLSVQEGSAKLSGPHGENEHILVAMDAGTYNVRKATCRWMCNNCNGAVSWALLANPFAVAMNGSTQLALTSTWNTGYQYNRTSIATWGSNNTSVATVNTGLVNGVAVGNVTINGVDLGEPLAGQSCGSPPLPCPPDQGISDSAPGTTAPRVDSITPSWGQVGTSVPVTISGRGFGTSPTVGFSGSGIAVTYGTRNDTTISGSFAIAPSAPIGFQTFTVQNNTTTDGSTPQSAPVNFQVTPATATPVNYHIVSESNLNDGSLFFTYTWSSSTGNQSDLYQCTVGESVYYPNYPSTPYIWPLPMVASTTNPTVLSGPGTYQGSTDQNYPPDSYSAPYSAASFNTTQRFWWTCSNYNNNAAQTLSPDVTITRKVFKDTDGFWKYQITKSGYTNTVRLPNQ